MDVSGICSAQRYVSFKVHFYFSLKVYGLFPKHYLHLHQSCSHFYKFLMSSLFLKIKLVKL